MAIASVLSRIGRAGLSRLRQNFPKVKFDFDDHPLYGVAANHPSYNAIRNQFTRPGSFTLSGKKRGEVPFGSAVGKEERLETLKSGLVKDLKAFEKDRILPKEPFTVSKVALAKKFKMDTPQVNKAIDQLRKEGKKIETTSVGTATPTQLKQTEIDKFKRSYKSESIGQMAKKMSGGGPQTEAYKAKYGQLLRLKDSLVKRKIIKESDVAKGLGAGKTGFKKDVASFEIYRGTQKKLMKNDPKSFEKYVTPITGETYSPAVLDRELLQLLNYNTVRKSLKTNFPEKLLPSFEHTVGITPATIIGDTAALRKVELATRRYNLKEMGARSGIFKDVKNYLRTAQANLNQGLKQDSEEALGVVNKIYDKVSGRFPSVSRKELPFFKVVGNKIKEINVPEKISQQTLRKSFSDYFRRVAPSATEAELATIARIQPNAYKAIKLYNEGKVREAGKVITGRLEQIAPGGNLIRGAKFAVPPILAYDMYDRFTYPSNPDQRESLFESPAVERSAILDL